MNCKDLARLLAETCAASLPPDDRAAADAHVAGCQACRDAWSDACESQELHAAVERLDTPSSVKGTVMARITGKAPDRAKDEPRAPRQIAGYEVLGLLGRGGMGKVFKARQVLMDRLVALKLLPARLAENETFVQRLMREARAAARLSHPNIVHAYDVGEADGHCYFAMEYIDGEGLDAALRREGPLKQNRVCRLMMQVASALAAAHEAGVIHRDIKPSNILLDTKGRARVADFGLAKRLEGDATTAAIGESLGTPAYAAPEVCAGRDIDARADLYSLGATFFHLLAGRPPFEDADAARVLVKQVKEPPPELGDVAPHVDPRLCRIIDRLLCKEPSERHPSARALLDELEALGELRPPTTRLQEAPTAPLRPGQKLLQEFELKQGRVGRRAPRRGLAALGAAAAVLLVVLALARWPRGRSAGARQAARVTSPTTSVAVEPMPPDRRQHNAEVIFRRAERAAALGQWVTVTRELDRLEQIYADTRFCASHRAAVATLRAQATERLRLTVITPKPEVVPEPPAPAPELPDRAGEWLELFDGETLRHWRVLANGHYTRHGNVGVAGGCLVLGRGEARTGAAWMGELPLVDYEVSLEARRAPGSDAYWCLGFPTSDGGLRLDVAEWKGTFVGLSDVDGRSCQYNDTARQTDIGIDRWVRVRVRVTKPRIEAWLDDDKVVDLERQGRQLTMPQTEAGLRALVLGTCRATASFRNVRVQRLPGEPEPPPVGGTEVAQAAVAVSARADWLDTGLHLSREKAYDISATGRWGFLPVFSVTADGSPRAEGHHPPHNGPMAYDLIARVGRHGRLLPVGRTGRVEPDQSGRLYFRMNDEYLGDNWGTLRVHVRGPMVADKEAPLLSRFPEPIARVAVRPADGWAFSGIELRRGERVLVCAEGAWDGGPQLGRVDGNGLDQRWRGLRAGALTGRIGEHGARFTIGTLHLLEATEAGKLFLAVNGVPGAADGHAARVGAAPLGPDPQPRPAGPPFPAPGLAPQGPEAAAGDEGGPTVTMLAAAGFEEHHGKPEGRAGPRCRLVATLSGHKGWVMAVAYSPDGTRLASASGDHTVKLWDGASGRCLRTLKGHRDWTRVVAFSPDGGQLVSASNDRTLRLWDLATGRCVRTLRGHRHSVMSVAFFGDGKRIASGSDDAAVLIWGAATGRIVRRLTGHRAAPFVAVSPDDSHIASAGKQGRLRLWDADTWVCEREVFARCGACWAVAFSPDGERVATGGDLPVVRLWDTATGRLLHSLAVPGAAIRGLAFSPNGQWLAASTTERTVLVWDAASFELRRTIDDHAMEVKAIAFSPDGRRLASASLDRTIKLWALDPPAPGGRPDAEPEAEGAPPRD